MAGEQTFRDPNADGWVRIDFLPGVELMPLAEPVKDGSIHRARLAPGTVIPVHTHPADEAYPSAKWPATAPNRTVATVGAAFMACIHQGLKYTTSMLFPMGSSTNAA